MTYNCPNCHRDMIPVCPIEVKKAIDRLLYLTSPERMEPYDLDSDSRNWKKLGNQAFWSAPFKPKNREDRKDAYIRAYRHAAQQLSDGWLPPGFILVTNEERNIETSDCWGMPERVGYMSAPGVTEITNNIPEVKVKIVIPATGCKLGKHLYPCVLSDSITSVGEP